MAQLKHRSEIWESGLRAKANIEFAAAIAQNELPEIQPEYISYALNHLEKAIDDIMHIAQMLEDQPCNLETTNQQPVNQSSPISENPWVIR